MKCPACHHALTRITIESLEVDACQFGCGGIWFDLFELQQVDDPGEVAGEALLQIPHNADVKVDPILKRECPRCLQMKLKRRPFSPSIPVEVDECPACGGFWLDAGELEQIRVQKGRLEKAPQRSTGMSPEAIRTLYRLKTADRDEL
ncbi:MAG TPA: zf-TFIIB domain-containing protein [Verrucomicrobiae bacterium]|nr:zf-TFIIB domain-containing protein [Verrucomicrobiae bacterium]